MPENSVSVRIQTRSRMLREELVEIIRAVGRALIQGPEDAGSCDLLIMEMGNDLEREFQLLNTIQSSGSAGEIFLTSENTHPEIFIRALRMGVKEFFPQPLNKEDVRTAYLKFIERNHPVKKIQEPDGRKGKILSIVGSKGGVGTTTIAVNLASSLMEMEGVGLVAVVDMNPLFGDVPFFLNLDVNGFDWLDVSKNIARVDETYLMSILLKHPSGIYVLPPPARLVDDPQAVARAMEILFAKMQNMFDFIVVDNGKSLNAVSKTVLKKSDRILIAALLSLPCLINIKRLREAMHDIGYLYDENIEIIVNRYQKNSLFTLKEAEDTMKRKVLWTLPNDYRTAFSAMNQGKPLNSAAGGAEISRSFKALAAMISDKNERKEKKKAGLFGMRSFSLLP
jgi:pilus assembly protein CpaE